MDIGIAGEKMRDLRIGEELFCRIWAGEAPLGHISIYMLWMKNLAQRSATHYPR